MDTPGIASAARALRHVFIRDLVLPARIGVHPHEHAGPQRVRINIDLGVEDDGARGRSRAAIGRTGSPAWSITRPSPIGCAPSSRPGMSAWWKRWPSASPRPACTTGASCWPGSGSKS